MKIEYEIKPFVESSVELKELWHFRELFYFFTWRDIKIKYKQTILGFLWAILQPLLFMVIFTLFLGRPFAIPTNGIPYPVFVFTGFILWNIFSGGINNMGNSVVSNAHIIKKIYFPRLIIPISALLVNMFDFLMTLIIYTLLLWYYSAQGLITINFINLLLFLPVSVILVSITTMGLGFLLSAMNVKYRDIRYIIPFMIQSLMFITPVIYPINMIKSELIRNVLALNPLYGAIELLRGGLTGQLPSLNLLAINFASATILLIIGFIYFRRTESYFADIA